MKWALITGEYPPAKGGVSDHSYLLAEGLAKAGDETHVIAPAPTGQLERSFGVCNHPLVQGFSPRGLASLHECLTRLPAGTRLLLQYVPHAFGLRGLNLPFCAYLAGVQRWPIDVVFHEVCYGWSTPLRYKDNILAGGQRVMAALIANKAQRLFVAASAWGKLVDGLTYGRRPTVYLPVISNVPTDADPSAVATWRTAWDPNGDRTIVGHFGTYGDAIAGLLSQAAADLLLREPAVTLLLIGRGSAEFAEHMRQKLPRERHRVLSTGALEPQRVASALRACDVMLQPYPDGVSSRRGSLIAALGLGLPIVTNEGPLTDPLWREHGAVALAPSVDALVPELRRVLHAVPVRAALGENARELYARKFALQRTLEALRSGV